MSHPECFDGDARAIAAALARRQHGAISIPQMIECGVPRTVVYREVEKGRWSELPGAVLVAATQPMTELTRCSAAVLMIRPDGALARHSALGLFGLAAFPDRVQVVTRHARRYRIPREVRVHRTRELPPGDIRELDGIRVTTIERTIVDVAPSCTRRHLTLVVDEAIRKGLTSAERIVVRALELKKFGRKGPKEVIELAATRPRSADAARSAWEILMARTVEEWGMPRPEFNVRITTPERSYECDLVWTDRRVIVECDSRIHDHEDQRQFDAQKDANLRAQGWTVLRVRIGDLMTRPQSTRRKLASALGLGTSRPAYGT